MRGEEVEVVFGEGRLDVCEGLVNAELDVRSVIKVCVLKFLVVEIEFEWFD